MARTIRICHFTSSSSSSSSSSSYYYHYFLSTRSVSQQGQALLSVRPSYQLGTIPYSFVQTQEEHADSQRASKLDNDLSRRICPLQGKWAFA